MDIRKKIGDRIKRSRKKLGLNIKELAEKTKSLTAARISHWENGKRSPGPTEAMILAKALNVAASYLLCLTNEVHGELVLDDSLLPRHVMMIPLTSAHQSKKAIKQIANDVSSIAQTTYKIALDHRSKEKIGANAFATVITDESMAPKFLPDDLIIVDPDRKPKPGDFVLAHIKGANDNIIRKYRETDQQLVNGGCCALIALSPDWGSIHSAAADNVSILGVIVEHREYW